MSNPFYIKWIRSDLNTKGSILPVCDKFITRTTKKDGKRRGYMYLQKGALNGLDFFLYSTAMLGQCLVSMNTQYWYASCKYGKVKHLQDI